MPIRIDDLLSERLGVTDLSDVTISSVAANDMISYDLATGEYVNRAYHLFGDATINEWAKLNYSTADLEITTGDQLGVKSSAIDCTATNATNLFTDVAHGMSDTDRVMIGGTVVPTGVDANIAYYVITSVADTFQISLTSGGSAVTFSDDGTSVQYYNWTGTARNNAIRFFYDENDVPDNVNGKSIYGFRKAAEGDNYFRFYINSSQNFRFMTDTAVSYFVNSHANGDIRFDCNTNFWFDAPGIILFGNPSAAENIDIRQYGYITAAGATSYVTWEVNDATDYFELTRHDANILGFDIQMPLVADSVSLSGSLSQLGGSTGVSLSGASGVLTMAGIGGSNNENITFDFEYWNNAVSLNSSTGVHTLYTYLELSFRDMTFMSFGSSKDVALSYTTTGNDNFQEGLICGSATNSGYHCIMEKADMSNANRSPLATSADPVLRIYSSDATQALDYGESYHDQTDFVNAWGNGDFVWKNVSTEAMRLSSAGNLLLQGNFATDTETVATLGVGVTTFAVTSNVCVITGDGGGNTVATITGGVSGQLLTLIFGDALVTITDDATGNADTINLSGAFTSTADDTMQLVYNGTSWRETNRSVN